ncbi:hypothetical protein [Pseudoxanthomonas sp. Root630]|uniref:hypothetical protein n=1 Tax=Pseudoxanthomonas sp. Root630 TaxID=1736574 RepID=UPI0007035D6B|nr:hypothetical protein [Pseudoxanthomonas sp. Root630]KRA44259.1 hypothetical protein ASD72_09575 [Pseudoxanthomonas sp. Root630]
MQLKYALAICACLVMADAAACNLSTGTTPFTVAATPAAEAGDALRAPALEMVSLTRGINGRASCDTSGLLTVSVEWPRGTDYKLRDLGFEFRVVGGEDRLSIFPGTPVAGRVDGRRSEFVFVWQDGPPAQQQPIDLVVEVRAVTPDNRRGPPAQLRIAVAPGS